jgi:hypothetical protein
MTWTVSRDVFPPDGSMGAIDHSGAWEKGGPVPLRVKGLQVHGWQCSHSEVVRRPARDPMPAVQMRYLDCSYKGGGVATIAVTCEEKDGAFGSTGMFLQDERGWKAQVVMGCTYNAPRYR